MIYFVHLDFDIRVAEPANKMRLFQSKFQGEQDLTRFHQLIEECELLRIQLWDTKREVMEQFQKTLKKRN